MKSTRQHQPGLRSPIRTRKLVRYRYFGISVAKVAVELAVLSCDPMTGRARLPGGGPRKASQKRFRPGFGDVDTCLVQVALDIGSRDEQENLAVSSLNAAPLGCVAVDIAGQITAVLVVVSPRRR